LKATTITTTTAITVDVHKKVAFISPLTTPTAERPLQSPTPTSDLPQPMKKIPSNCSGRVSTTGPASSRTDLSVKSENSLLFGRPRIPHTPKGSSRIVHPSNRPSDQVPRIPKSNSSRIMIPASWSEHTEVDLVANLGSREHTRQEVLLEIVPAKTGQAIGSILSL